MSEFLGHAETLNGDRLRVEWTPDAEVHAYDIELFNISNLDVENARPQLMFRFKTDDLGWVSTPGYYETQLSGFWSNKNGDQADYVGAPHTGGFLEFDNQGSRFYGMSGTLQVTSLGALGSLSVFSAWRGFMSQFNGPMACMTVGNFNAGPICGFEVFCSPDGLGNPGENLRGRIEVYGKRSSLVAPPPPPPPPPPSVSRSKSFAIGSNGSNNANQNWRIVLAPATWGGIQGSATRLSLKAATSGPLEIAGLYIGVWDDPLAPYIPTAFTPVTFGGQAGVIIPAGQVVASDIVPFTIEQDRYYIASFDVVSGALQNGSGFSDVHSWVFNGPQADVLVPAGTAYDIGNGVVHGLAEIEW